MNNLWRQEAWLVRHVTLRTFPNIQQTYPTESFLRIGLEDGTRQRFCSRDVGVIPMSSYSVLHEYLLLRIKLWNYISQFIRCGLKIKNLYTPFSYTHAIQEHILGFSSVIHKYSLIHYYTHTYWFNILYSCRSAFPHFCTSRRQQSEHDNVRLHARMYNAKCCSWKHRYTVFFIISIIAEADGKQSLRKPSSKTKSRQSRSFKAALYESDAYLGLYSTFA